VSDKCRRLGAQRPTFWPPPGRIGPLDLCLLTVDCRHAHRLLSSPPLQYLLSLLLVLSQAASYLATQETMISTMSPQSAERQAAESCLAPGKAAAACSP
jgi:hypothetical protein